MTSDAKSLGKWPLRLSGLFFAIYVGNVLLGKFTSSSSGEGIGLNDVAEFLTLFAAAICFVISILIKEAGTNGSPSE